MEEPCGIVLIGASLPRKVVAWERTQGAVVEATQGFTLIELSIVLVIIGLIVGGVLVGQDLIKAAQTRAQIAQIERFNSAVNAFKNKYNAIPGDMDPISAANFGFSVGANCAGQQAGARDGNGLLDGWIPPTWALTQGMGETSLFWQDLSTANMIDGTFPNNGGSLAGCTGGALALTSTPGTLFVGNYFPTAKIGQGNYLYVYENNGANWYGLSAVTGIVNNGALTSNAGISVSQAYNIDKKIDDGLPTSGGVQATYLNNNTSFVNAAPSTNTSGGNAISCYDTTTNTYSTGINNGANPNCALSFKMQGAAR